MLTEEQIKEGERLLDRLLQDVQKFAKSQDFNDGLEVVSGRAQYDDWVRALVTVHDKWQQALDRIAELENQLRLADSIIANLAPDKDE